MLVLNAARTGRTIQTTKGIWETGGKSDKAHCNTEKKRPPASNLAVTGLWPALKATETTGKTGVGKKEFSVESGQRYSPEPGKPSQRGVGGGGVGKRYWGSQSKPGRQR